MAAPLFHERSATFAWGLIAVWLGMLGMLTWLFLHEGGFGQFAYGIEVAIIAGFWFAGLGGAAHFLSEPVTRVTVEGAELRVAERTLFGQRVRRVPLAGLPPPRLVETKDSDGDAYFRCQIDLGDGTPATFFAGHRREEAEAAMDRFAVACGRG
jgi:hypothetical protein